MKWIQITGCILVCLAAACTRHNNKGTTITVYLQSAYNKTLFLEQLGVNGQEDRVIDSAFIPETASKPVRFRLAEKEPGAYRLRFMENGQKGVFILDSPAIDIFFNYVTGKMVIQGSPASMSFMTFQKMQSARSVRFKYLNNRLEQLNKKGRQQEAMHLSLDIRDSMAAFYAAYKKYADTVSNPVVFMLLFDHVYFGGDYQAQLAFVEQAAQRFPAYAPLQELKQQVNAVLRIQQNEYNIGDTLPDLALPNQYGINVSLRSFRGKFCFIDFWSTWCPQCMVYDKIKRQVKDALPEQQFQIVSIAIDAERQSWQAMVQAKNYNWPQLIDEKMWQGKAVQILQFDSIPFNFLISPEGRVVGKAIPPDSVLPVIKRVMQLQ